MSSRNVVGTLAIVVIFVGRTMLGCTGEDASSFANPEPCKSDAECTLLCTTCDLTLGKCVPVARGAAATNGVCPPKNGSDTICTPGGCDGTLPKCLQEDITFPCRPASCDPVQRAEILTAYCAAEGTCAIKDPASCGGNGCNGNACARACALDGECTETHFCDGANCQPKKDPGTQCVDKKECKSGFCADGVCCDKACSGACEKCNAAGMCTLVTQATAVHGMCTNQGVEPCGGRCDGKTADCTYPTTECQPASCHCTMPFTGVAAGCFFKPAVACVAGSCATTNETICPNGFACNGTACHTKPCDDTQPTTDDHECYHNGQSGGFRCAQARVPANNSCITVP